MIFEKRISRKNEIEVDAGRELVFNVFKMKNILFKTLNHATFNDIENTFSLPGSSSDLNKVWRKMHDIPKQDGFSCVVQQYNSTGTLEEVFCTVRKDKGGFYILVENKTCFVVRMDRALNWKPC